VHDNFEEHSITIQCEHDLATQLTIAILQVSYCRMLWIPSTTVPPSYLLQWLACLFTSSVLKTCLIPQAILINASFTVLDIRDCPLTSNCVDVEKVLRYEDRKIGTLWI
jgi:hypothetical protein